MATKEELKKLLADNTASIYARLLAIKKLYLEEYKEFNLEVDINSRDRFGRTAFMVACEYQHIKVVEVLIEAGVDINAQDYFGVRPLMWACSRNHNQIVDILIKAGADIKPGEFMYERLLEYMKTYNEKGGGTK